MPSVKAKWEFASSVRLLHYKGVVVSDIITFDIDDIASDLVILNKHTIDTLFSLKGCVNCVALYMFYYKTAKWQKTDKVRATDSYVMKCLSWGKSKLTEVKSQLQECGLIETVQLRENGRIKEWLVKVHYIVPKEKAGEMIVLTEDSKKYCEQEVVETRSCPQNTKALRYKPIYLKKE